MNWVFNKKTGGKFDALCDMDCIRSIQTTIGGTTRCSNCGFIYSRDEPHPLALGNKQKGGE